MKTQVEVQLLRHILKLDSEPARRHRCPDCNEVFECHLCTIEAEHPLHKSSHNCPLLCLECAEHQGIDSITVLDNDNRFNMYDYTDGSVVKYDYILGWKAFKPTVYINNNFFRKNPIRRRHTA